MGIVADGIVHWRLQIHVFAVSPQVAGVYGQREPVISISQRIGFVPVKSDSFPAILALISIPDYGDFRKKSVSFLMTLSRFLLNDILIISEVASGEYIHPTAHMARCIV